MIRKPVRPISGILLFLTAVSLFAQEPKIKISDDLDLVKISEHAWMHTSYVDFTGYAHFPANGLIYMEDDSAFIMDTPWNDDQTRDLLHYLKNSLNIDVKGVIVNHWHRDCMGGLQAVHEAGIPSIAYRLTAGLADSAGLPVPRVIFNDSLTLQLGNAELICYFLGEAHAHDNIVVWMPTEKILFGGCMVKGLNWNSLGNLKDANVDAWPHTLRRCLEKFPEAEIVIQGHGPYGGLNLIHHTLDILERN